MPAIIQNPLRDGEEDAGIQRDLSTEPKIFFHLSMVWTGTRADLRRTVALRRSVVFEAECGGQDDLSDRIELVVSVSRISSPSNRISDTGSASFSFLICLLCALPWPLSGVSVTCPNQSSNHSSRFLGGIAIRMAGLYGKSERDGLLGL